MAKGYSQREAHNLANEKYDYEKTLKRKRREKIK